MVVWMKCFDEFLGLDEADGMLYFDLTMKEFIAPKFIDDILDPG